MLIKIKIMRLVSVALCFYLFRCFLCGEMSNAQTVDESKMAEVKSGYQSDSDEKTNYALPDINGSNGERDSEDVSNGHAYAPGQFIVKLKEKAAIGKRCRRLGLSSSSRRGLYNSFHRYEKINRYLLLIQH